jgi:hypothetical protein
MHEFIEYMNQPTTMEQSLWLFGSSIVLSLLIAVLLPMYLNRSR